MVQSLDGPCMLHVVTKKGKGYGPAEADAIGAWHGVKPFSINTGLPIRPKAENERSWSTIIRTLLMGRAANDPKFRVIVPAMIYGSDLTLFQQTYPEQLLDVGICESFSVCFAGAAALRDIPVFVPIYSSFLQRAYDQVLHDVARQNLRVVFGVDRCGLVGEDGETHHGIYDISYLSHIPNMTIVQAKDPIELAELFAWAFDVAAAPVAIRYSNQIAVQASIRQTKPILQPSWTVEREGSALVVIAYGDTLTRISLLLERQPMDVCLINARFIKPLDETMLHDLASRETPIVVVEEVHAIGGLGAMILLFFQAHGYHHQRVAIRAIPDQYVPHGALTDLHRQLGLDDKSLTALFQSFQSPKE
ncbi:MAG: hypothetical protein MZU97_04070 [Bacillus subtilis]|nr:hypothetical protein [Bacillus subtilis]